MHIGVLTSGGDAPGMNACIRAVVRAAIRRGISVTGIRRGFIGIGCEPADTMPLSTGSVSNVLHRGGTILKTGRCPDMHTPQGRDRAAAALRSLHIDVLIAIGGNGTMAGLAALREHWNGGMVLVPGSIDNDVGGTEAAIGYDTAVNTALEAIDRVRDTAEAFDRVFLIEVMGRYCGSIALGAALAGGAEEVIVPETRTDLAAIADRLAAGQRAGRGTSIIVVSEHDEAGSATEIAAWLQRNRGIETRVCVLGHVQRGGSPTAADRILASRLGAYAVTVAHHAEGRLAVAVGVRRGGLVTTDLEEALRDPSVPDPDLADLIAELAR